MRNHHRREDESPLVGKDDAPSKSDDDQKRYKSIWWCCFGDEGDDECEGGGRSCALRTASRGFQRIRRYTASSVGSNHWDDEGNKSDARWLHKGWKNSVRRTREWCESMTEYAQDAVGSCGPKSKRFVGILKIDIDEMRSKLCHSNKPRFQYDAFSYALNFDEGISRHNYEPFAGRFASPVPVPVEK